MFKKLCVSTIVALGLMIPATSAPASVKQVESSRVTDHGGYGGGGYGGGYECMSHECGGNGYGGGYEGDRSDRRYEDGGYNDWGGGSDGNSGGRYEGGRGGSDYDGDGDGNRCRNFCFYGIPEPQQASLFPVPTPEGVRDFVVSVMKSSMEMGRLFADTTITFVENLMFGLA